MSDDDEFQLYGTLLEPYDEDAVPKKKAFTIEDQIATDDQGRRRFHGAFTGGFSAGYFNTVGSVEGWQPAEFKSSRGEKAEKNIQKPQDFMDDEDRGQFGIAPSVVRATSDYSSSVKRKRVVNEGPIPGIPVLELLQPAKDTVGVKLLKQMGWKPGQGVGPRLTKKEKRKVNPRSGKIYGCEIPREFRQNLEDSDGASSDSSEDDITFAPDDYDPFIAEPKDNSFGMGYKGLDKRPILSGHINLFDPPPAELFKMRDHKNSKISISGQAFGVGAFEQEDEDIYTRDDMSKYDFELGVSKKPPSKKKLDKPLEKILEGFVISDNSVLKKAFPPPILPKNFIPKHGVRLSRFEPLPQTHKLFNYDRKMDKKGRHDLSSAERAKILNSETVVTKEKGLISVVNNTPEIEKEVLVKKAAEITKNLPPTKDTNFKPFQTNPDKQNRYEQYLILEKEGKDKQLHEIQPASMADWEKERERYEFAQASRMFKQVAGLVFDKFVVASTPEDPFKPPEKTIYLHGSEDMRNAAEKKMFGPLTRSIELWVPHKLLCRRFNVPEPDVTETEMSLSKKKKGKYNVFDYYEAYQQNKTVKEGPEMPPKTEEKVKEPKIAKSKTDENVEEPKITKTKTDEVVPEIAPKKMETFKTSKTIFLEESSRIQPIEESPCMQPSTSTYKKPEVVQPKPIIPTDPKEKKDLFKAIFLSSSESEDETLLVDNLNEMKKIVLEPNTPQFDQPIVNASKGIFSNLDWSKVNRNPLNKEVETLTPPKITETIDIYGPKLPTSPCLIKKSAVLDKNSAVLLDDKKAKSFASSSSSEDDWMEANSSEKSSKTSKKHKKHKSKHKKHKSKHKKKKSKH